MPAITASTVRRDGTRRTETPNAGMTTYASPTLGGAAQALWQVEMVPGATGPEHVMVGEQVWMATGGAATVRVGDDQVELAAGDTLVLPAGVVRRIAADPARGFVAIVSGVGGAHACTPGGEPVVPAWIA